MQHDLFDRGVVSKAHVTNRAYRSHLLKDDSVFREAVNDIFNKLVEEEDTITAEQATSENDGRDYTSIRDNIAKQRVALLAVVKRIDDYIADGEKIINIEQSQKEQSVDPVDIEHDVYFTDVNK